MSIHDSSRPEQEIHLLPDFIANQIAAGEVVQRPESVVKELVENAIDAGASAIAVVVRQSGKQLIHVVDNGKGMSRADLALALKRHATSKISSQEDLYHIMTLGFRGEALASIASVASIEIRTKREDDELGSKLIAVPNEVETIELCQMDRGTHIFVRNLFYNVPARKKFLRSDITEFRHIADTMTKFALAHPAIRFTLYDDDALVFDVHPGDMQKRIVDLMGETVAGRMIPIAHTTPLVQVHGFVSLPQFASKARSDQYLFLNGRTILNRQITHAVMSAFEHLITHASYPAFIVFIQVDPTHVDINVHPQKHEVKFDDDRTVYSAVREAVTAGLRNADIVPEASFRTFDSTRGAEGLYLHTPQQTISGVGQSNVVMVNRLTGEILPESPIGATIIPQSPTHYNHEIQTYRQEGISRQDIRKTMSAYDILFGAQSAVPSEPSSPVIDDPLQNDHTVGNSPEQGMLALDHTFDKEEKNPFVYQLHRKYLLMPIAKGVQVIDQHIAHERILYERALHAMNREYVYAQELLFPVAIQITPHDGLLLKELSDELHTLGYYYTIASHDDSGTASLVHITAVPQDVPHGNAWQSLQELIEQYREYAEVRHTSLRDNLAASFACRASVKAGDYLSQEQMHTMIRDLYKCAMPYVCPHGRPVMIDIRTEELDRRFGRSVQK